MDALAISDHQGLYGAVKFHTACREHGIKMFIVPLVVVLFLSLDPVLGSRIQDLERSSSRTVRGMTGALLVVLGLALLIWVV